MCASEIPGTGGPSARQAQEACAAFLDGFGGEVDLASLPGDLVQRLLTLAVGAYAAKLDAGEPCRPFSPDSRLTASDVCPVVAHMLRAVDVDLFELAMWQHVVDE